MEQFTVPLQGAGAQVGEIHFEFDAIMQYAIEYVIVHIKLPRGMVAALPLTIFI